MLQESKQLEVPIQSTAVNQFRPALSVTSPVPRPWLVQASPLRSSLNWSEGFAQAVYESFGVVIGVDEPIQSTRPSPFNVFVGGLSVNCGPRGVRWEVFACSVQAQVIVFPVVTTQLRVLLQIGPPEAMARRDSIILGEVSDIPGRSFPRFSTEYRVLSVDMLGTHRLVDPAGNVVTSGLNSFSGIPNSNAADWTPIPTYAAGIRSEGDDFTVEAR